MNVLTAQLIGQTIEIITERGPQVTGPSGPWLTVAVVALSLIGYAVWLAFVYNSKK